VIELTPEQMAVLERLRARGFQFAAFPLFPTKIGVRKGNCAALLDPVAGDGLRLFGDPCYLVAGNPGVLTTRAGRKMFVWKKSWLEASPERLDELERFRAELTELLAGPVP